MKHTSKVDIKVIVLFTIEYLSSMIMKQVIDTIWLGIADAL